MSNENAKTTDKNACQKTYERACARYEYARRYALRNTILIFAIMTAIILPLILWAQSNEQRESAEACQEFCTWQQKDAINFNRFGCVCKQRRLEALEFPYDVDWME